MRKNKMTDKKKIAQEWFSHLRDQICSKFEEIDGGKFTRKAWDRPGGGGGVMSVMKGNVFEKVGVNIAYVEGELSEQFRKEIPGAEENSKFFATGISLVAHMVSPHVPAVHMNTRYIVTSQDWFGGGADLTPIYPNDQDTKDFHAAFKDACDKHDPQYYPKFSKWADEYFYLKHREEPRGIGGIFYDNLPADNWEKNFAFTQDVGKTFLEIYPQLVIKNMDKEWNDEERQYQLLKRGRYVEFNLLHDRGTRFGFMTGGNTEAILMSLPPLVAW
jgi:coproporphyrinogen III oxidase